MKCSALARRLGVDLGLVTRIELIEWAVGTADQARGDAGIMRGRGYVAMAMWQQSENVVFEQSRNVVLTAPSLGDAGRTTTDDPSRS